MVPRRCVVTGAVAVLVLLVTACAEAPRLPPVAVTASSTPLFASDDEALAVATDAYEAYLAMSNVIAREGGRASDRLREYVSAELFDAENEGFTRLFENGWRTTGDTVVVRSVLQQVIESDEATLIIVYVCTSTADNDLVDAAGVSLMPPDTPAVLAHEVVMTAHSPSDLLISEKTFWNDPELCR